MSVDCTFWSTFSKSAESATLVRIIFEQLRQPISFQYMTLPLYYRIASGLVKHTIATATRAKIYLPTETLLALRDRAFKKSSSFTP